MVKVQDVPSINIASGLRARSKKEELAYDNPGHMHEYIFNQTLAPFHWEWIEMIQEGFRDPYGPYNPLLILAPRDHAKTSICAETIPLHRIGINHLTMAQIIGSVSPEAEKRLRKVGNVIRFNKSFINLFGALYPEDDIQDYTWNNRALEVRRNRTRAYQEGVADRDYTLVAHGITTSVEGGRAHLQIFDDIVGMENSRTEHTRSAISEKFWMSFDPMLFPEGQQIIIGTRYHYEDFYYELFQKFDSFKNYTGLYETEV